MRHGLRLVTGTALALAMLAGDVATLSLVPAAALADGRAGHGGFGGGLRGGEHGGFRGHDGFRGGFGGYRGYGGYGGYGGYYRGGLGDTLFGALLLGGTAAIIASSRQPVYEAPAYPVYQTYPPAGAAGPDYAPVQGAVASTDPVDQCSRTAEREAAAHGDTGRVVSIDHVDGYANGARVTGTLEIRRSDRAAPTTRARFTCAADYGQVTAFHFG